MEKQNLTIRQGWPASLTQMSDFLNRNWEYDTINPTLLEEKLSGDPTADPSLCFTAYNKEEIVGFLFCVQRNIRGVHYGYVKLFAVDKAWRRQKVGTSLYEQAEAILQKKGSTHLRWYDVPLNYFMPGLDPRYTEAFCFAQKQGFQQFGESVNMLVDLRSRNWNTLLEEEALLEKGVEIRRAGPKDKADLIELLSKEWILWNNEVNMALRDDPPSVHVAFLHKKMVAFSVHNGNNKGTGWFGPMGTAPETRGLGLGGVLLKRCLEDMRLQGHTHAIIPWVAPIAFYAHYAGAKINRVFWRMEKQLKSK